MDFTLRILPCVVTIFVTRLVSVIEGVNTFVLEHLADELVLHLGRLSVQAENPAFPAHLIQGDHVVLAFDDCHVFSILDGVLPHHHDVVQPAFLLNLPRQFLPVRTGTLGLEGKTRWASVNERRINEGFLRQLILIRTATFLQNDQPGSDHIVILEAFSFQVLMQLTIRPAHLEVEQGFFTVTAVLRLVRHRRLTVQRFIDLGSQKQVTVVVESFPVDFLDGRRLKDQTEFEVSVNLQSSLFRRL